MALVLAETILSLNRRVVSHDNTYGGGVHMLQVWLKERLGVYVNVDYEGPYHSGGVVVRKPLGLMLEIHSFITLGILLELLLPGG